MSSLFHTSTLGYRASQEGTLDLHEHVWPLRCQGSADQGFVCVTHPSRCHLLQEQHFFQPQASEFPEEAEAFAEPPQVPLGGWVKAAGSG